MNLFILNYKILKLTFQFIVLVLSLVLYIQVFLRLEHEASGESEKTGPDTSQNTLKCDEMQTVETPLPAVESNEYNLRNNSMKGK